MIPDDPIPALPFLPFLPFLDMTGTLDYDTPAQIPGLGRGPAKRQA